MILMVNMISHVITISLVGQIKCVWNIVLVQSAQLVLVSGCDPSDGLAQLYKYHHNGEYCQDYLVK